MIEDRYGDWMLTASGKVFWPLDPRPEEVDAGDIAHALSLICRFGGHCREFYSVAQHSVLVAHEAMRLCGDRERAPAVGLLGILHDAAEAYVGDMIGPMKRARELEPYCAIEMQVLDAINMAFEVPLLIGAIRWQGDPTALVHVADCALLSTEIRDLRVASPRPLQLRAPPLPEKIEPWAPARAQEEFLRLLWCLMPGGKFPRREGSA